MDWKEAVERMSKFWWEDRRNFKVGETTEAHAEELLKEITPNWPPDQFARARTNLIREAQGDTGTV